MNNETLNTGKNGRRITIKNIADELNLSSSAVSAILNKKKNCFASKKTKENVFRTASELNYRPNRFARSLRTRKSDSIGIIVTSFEVNVLLNAIQFVESLAWKRNYRLFIANSNGDPDREELLLDEFYSTPVDGIILIPTGLSSTNSFLRQLTAEEFPVVTVNPVENVSVDFVATNYRKGGFIAVEHLVNLGYKEIGFFGNSLNRTFAKNCHHFLKPHKYQ